VTHSRPNDERGFVHKRIGRAIGGFIGGGIPGAIGGFVGGGGGATQLQCPPGQRPSKGRCINITSQWLLTSAGRAFQSLTSGGAAIACPEGMRETADGRCVDITTAWQGGQGVIPGLDDCLPGQTRVGDICTWPGTPAGPAGEAVMGPFGAGLEPFFATMNVRRCLPGMVLGRGNNGLPLCYNKSQLKNSERLWPAARKPLLTGGDLNAIRKAAAAGRKLETATKRLQRIGLMKKPKGGGRRSLPALRPTVKLIESGPGSVQL